MRIYILSSIITIFGITACSENIKKTKVINEYEAENMSYQEKDFDSFLNRFKCDTLFQYDRINFPVKGYNSNYDKEYAWNKVDWIFYYYEDFCINALNNIYSESIENNDEYKIWRVFIENSGYDTYLRFKLIDNKWMLVEYDYSNF